MNQLVFKFESEKMASSIKLSREIRGRKEKIL